MTVFLSKNNRVARYLFSGAATWLMVRRHWFHLLRLWDGKGAPPSIFSNHLKSFGMPTCLILKILSVWFVGPLSKGRNLWLQLILPPVRRVLFILSIADYREKIGDTVVSAMKQAHEGEALCFLEPVFPTLTEEVIPSESKSVKTILMEHFQRLMARDGLRFGRRAGRCFGIACHRRWKWTWFET